MQHLVTGISHTGHCCTELCDQKHTKFYIRTLGTSGPMSANIISTISSQKWGSNPPALDITVLLQDIVQLMM